jgi:hypothetical protein
MARSRKATERNRDHRQENRTAALVLIDSKLLHARRDVEEAISTARSVGLDEDAVEILEASMDKLASATQLLRLAIAGAINVDWDAEMAKLGDAS